MSFRYRSIISILVLPLLLGSLLLGQRDRDKDEKTRAVQGIVTGSAEQPVPQAVVQLKDTKTQQIRSFITKDDGSFRFFGLNPNVEYELTAAKDGTGKSEVRKLSTFDSRKMAIINLKLEPAQ
jgi:hypothetical protein